MIFDRLVQKIRPRPTSDEESRLLELRLQLLLQRRWSYLRYVHLREGLLTAIGHARGTDQLITSFLAVGAGRGLAEIALAVEFPKIHFVITDVISPRTPNYQAAQALAARWKLQNVAFDTLDVSHPIPDRYDVIASTEVVEHIKDDAAALQNMLDAADHSVYCLAPFADEKTLNDPNKQAKAWTRHEHYRYGYSVERFQSLFPDIIDMRGCYWRERGFQHRTELGDLADPEIKKKQEQLASAAHSDILNELPKELSEAQGIWVLARAPRRRSSPKTGTQNPAHAIASEPADRKSSQLDTPAGQLEEVRKRLVFYRSWSYLRYVHLREAFLETRDVKTVLSIGCGRGLAELALAIEFPEVQFLLTDIKADDTSSTDPALELARTWALKNISFRHLDILDPEALAGEKFDFVCSVEVLEHIQNDRLAAECMRRLSSRYLFCLVPFADRKTDSNPERRKRAWEKDRHYRFGYSGGELRALFPGESIVRGSYWRNGGGPVPSRSDGLDDATLLSQVAALQNAAQDDIVDKAPDRYPESLGIWILSEQ